MTMIDQVKEAFIPPAVADLLEHVPSEPRREEEGESSWVLASEWHCDLNSLYGRR